MDILTRELFSWPGLHARLLAAAVTKASYVSLVVPPSGRHSTPVVKRTLNPTFPAAGSTFDFPLYLSLAGVVGGRGIEGVVWDKVRHGTHYPDLDIDGRTS